MATRFVSIDRETPLLLPPNLRDWVPAGHLVHFVVDAVAALDLRHIKVNERGTGSEQYPPSMMLALLIYSYATGTFSSRRIEQSTYDSVPVRLLTADTHPDHNTICTFRRENQALLSESFVKVLEMAQKLIVLKFGQMTVSIDGTKVMSNASKNSSVSYERAGEMMAQLELEVKQLLEKGFVYTEENRNVLRALQRYFPVIQRSQYKNKSIYYLEDKSILEMDRMP
jgi:transposase